MIAGKLLSCSDKPGRMHFLMRSSLKKGEKKKQKEAKEWEFEEVKQFAASMNDEIKWLKEKVISLEDLS